MNSRSNTFKKLGVIFMMMLFVSCQDTLPKRSTITSGDFVEDPTACEDGFTYNETTKICVADPVSRPTGVVTFDEDNNLCVCKDRKVYSYGSCSSFCANKGTAGQPILYASFNVGPEILLNTAFNDLKGWCNNVLEGSTSQAGCVLKAKDAEGNIKEAQVILSGNTLTANLSALEEDKTYQLQLVETSSGSTSNTTQIIRYSVDVASASLGVLKPAPISQYACVIKSLTSERINGVTNVFSDFAYKVHFYFLPSNPPEPISATSPNIICHDPISNSEADDIEFERLDLKAGPNSPFTLWDKTDPRFFDNNNNTFNDVNDIIIQKTKNFGSTIGASTNFFTTFTWPGSPVSSTTAGDTTANRPLGYYMQPWIDSNTFLSYCLNSTHYNSSNALFRAMGDVLQVDTEGLYVGVKAAESVNVDGTTYTGVKDYLLVRESDLKRVWFYKNGSTPTAPSDANVRNVAVYFYYPFNFASPYIKSSGQRVFQVKGAEELSNTATNTSNTGTTSSGTNLQYPPHDRKIGCVPKIR